MHGRVNSRLRGDGLDVDLKLPQAPSLGMRLLTAVCGDGLDVGFGITSVFLTSWSALF